MNLKSIQWFKGLLAAAGLVLVSVSSHAEFVSQVGDDVTFTYDDGSLYGTGSVVGNTISFSPVDFLALSENTDGADIATATLNIDIEVNAGSNYIIDSFLVAEAGDYLLNGSSATASAEGRLQVTSNTTNCPLFACMATDLFSAGPLTDQGTLTEWTMGGSVDLAGITGWGSDTHVNAQIQNVLTATSTVLGESALVQKKFEGVAIEVTVVPLPAAAWLFGSALAGLVGLRRRFRH